MIHVYEYSIFPQMICYNSIGTNATRQDDNVAELCEMLGKCRERRETNICITLVMINAAGSRLS